MYNGLEEWACTISIFLKKLIIYDEINRRVSAKIRQDFLDVWRKIIYPKAKSKAIDKFEAVQKKKKRKRESLKILKSERNLFIYFFHKNHAHDKPPECTATNNLRKESELDRRD